MTEDELIAIRRHNGSPTPPDNVVTIDGEPVTIDGEYVINEG